MKSEDHALSEPPVPVPQIFRSTETGDLIERCAVCDRPLLDSSTDYVIEKAFRSYQGFDSRETIFEYALCSACRDELMAELSRESLERIQGFFSARVDVALRRLQMLNAAESEPDVGPWISSCLVSGEPIDDLEEYQIYCECRGHNILPSRPPFLIGGPVLDEIADLLSNKTLDELNGFADDILGLPPELEELFRRRVVLL